ncbi:MAG: hypothetical protein AAF564_23785 [Bacteroidota bacterium]
MSNLVTLRPGARGTIRLVHEYGDKLICVRYRYKQDTRTRIKTVELVVDERPWTPRRLKGQRRWRYLEQDDSLIEGARPASGAESVQR